MIQVRQTFDAAHITDIEEAIRGEMELPEIRACVCPGDRVAVCVGSRGIHKIDKIVYAVLENLTEFGAVPFLVPAMGSHGGATGPGQREVLASYGITEETMRVPIRDSMETLFLGNSEGGVPVYFSREAWEADWILPINRVKAHTDFSGPIESGLVKMLAIGLGKEKGCSTLHHCGTDRFAQIIPDVGRKILETGKVRFGLAIVENGYDQTAVVKSIKGNDILTEESLLLLKAKALMPGIPFSHIDVLVIEEFGKDISGSGMDPNITGRRSSERIDGFQGPEIQQIVVLRLTEQSHGNAIAINAADFITRELFDKIDLQATYKNSLACCNPASGKIPIIAENEEEAISFAVSCCRGIDPSAPRIVRIKNTLALDRLLISESLREEAQGLAGVEILT